MKNFYSLPTGAVFKAQILDIRPGKVTILLDDGGRFTARSMVYPDAHIGEESYFRVKENNFEGLIQLEMVKGTPGESQGDSGSGGAKAQTQAQNMDKSVFLLKEGFPTDAASLRALDRVIDPERHLTKLLGGVANYISLDDGHELKPLCEFYKELYDTLKQFKSKGSTPADILRKLDAIEENLQFMQKVRKHVRYYQIPFVRNGRTGQGELFLYPSGESVVALDTENLGRIEVVVNGGTEPFDGTGLSGGTGSFGGGGNDRQLTFRFLGNSEDILDSIKSKDKRLVKDLHRKGYQVSEMTYEKRLNENERTTVLTDSSGKPIAPVPEPQRYTFDMRV